jgi:hypothetical protein
MKKKKTFQITINEGDAVIKLTSDRIVELLFAEDDETIVRERKWPEQEVYKTAVQFALMIDTFFKNGEGLDSLIMHSPTGSIVAELIGQDMFGIKLGSWVSVDSHDKEEEELSSRLEEVEEDLKNNVVDATTRFTKKENDDGDK